MPLVAVGLLALLACMMMMATSAAYRSTLGALLEELAKAAETIIPRIPVVHYDLGAHIASWLRSVNNAILRILGEGIAGTQGVWHRFVHAMAVTFQRLGHSIDGVSAATADTFDYFRKHVLPTAIATALLGPLAALKLLKQQVAEIHPAVNKLVRVFPKTVYRDVPHALTQAEKASIAALVTVPAVVAKAVAVPIPRIGQLEREASAAEKWIKTNAKKLTVGGIVGLAVAAIGRLGLGWTRCSNVSRVGKALCGMERSILDDLLAGALIVASSISVVELAHECQAFTGTVDEGLRLFVRELS